MTLRDRIDAAIAYTDTVKGGNSDVSGVWYRIDDAPLAEIQAEADRLRVTLCYQEKHMVLQYSIYPSTTIFVHSIPLNARIVYEDKEGNQC
jgi:hypothetical protein